MYGELQAKPHMLAAQVGVALSGGMHTLPQAPQLPVLPVVSTHEPLQFVAPLQLAVHMLDAHTSFAPQAVMQSPQCPPSDVKSTQAPLQLV
jgi:hypothetical protein